MVQRALWGVASSGLCARKTHSGLRAPATAGRARVARPGAARAARLRAWWTRRASRAVTRLARSGPPFEELERVPLEILGVVPLASQMWKGMVCLGWFREQRRSATPEVAGDLVGLLERVAYGHDFVSGGACSGEDCGLGRSWALAPWP